MAAGLGMATTAEGVETEAERELVQRLGCTQIQGFLIGRPERREHAAPSSSDAAEKIQEAVVADLPPMPRRAIRR